MISPLGCALEFGPLKRAAQGRYPFSVALSISIFGAERA